MASWRAPGGLPTGSRHRAMGTQFLDACRTIRVRSCTGLFGGAPTAPAPMIPTPGTALFGGAPMIPTPGTALFGGAPMALAVLGGAAGAPNPWLLRLPPLCID
jgi:hypothetical protein